VPSQEALVIGQVKTENENPAGLGRVKRGLRYSNHYNQGLLAAPIVAVSPGRSNSQSGKIEHVHFS